MLALLVQMGHVFGGATGSLGASSVVSTLSASPPVVSDGSLGA